MTDEDILSIAKEAGFGDAWLERARPGFPALPREGLLIGFAKMIASHEREQCAKVCESGLILANYGQVAAKAIRARAPR